MRVLRYRPAASGAGRVTCCQPMRLTFPVVVRHHLRLVFVLSRLDRKKGFEPADVFHQ